MENIINRPYRVCVLLTTYNGERFLNELIDSVLSQTGVSLCILVRDDGSTDSTISILNRYKKKANLEWYSGEHLGVEYGFLDLINKAPEADFFAFCDQDDVWETTKLQQACDKLSAYAFDKPSLYCSSLKLVDSNLKFMSINRINAKRSPFARFIYPGVAGCTMVFNKTLKSFLVNKHPNNIRMHDIWVYDVCSSLGGNIVLDKDSFINYRQHENNVVGLKNKKKASNFRIFVFENKLSERMLSLKMWYETVFDDEYKNLVNLICTSNSSVKSRFRLFFNKKIKFGSFALTMLFKVKIILRRM